MSSYPLASKIIHEITDDLYPKLEGEMEVISNLSEIERVPELERAYQLFDELKTEFKSLAKYETKMVFPGIDRYFGDNVYDIPQRIHVHELYELLKKKEIYIKEKLLELDAEMELHTCKGRKNILALANSFKKSYFAKKETLYKVLTILQKEKYACSVDYNDISLPNSIN